jgi:hypothetical protein
MLVDFLIIGAQKGGSTWLYDMLRLHPHISTPTLEVHFFSDDTNYGKGVGWYHDAFQEKSGVTLYGEKTPEYLTLVPTANPRTSIETGKRIFGYNPEMKLIAVLREPVARLRSAINHMYRTRRIPPWINAKDLVLGQYRSVGEAFSLLENGRYYESLLEYFRLFPSAQIKILFFETNVVQSPADTLRDICLFLDVPFDACFFPLQSVKKNEYQMSLPSLVLNYFFPFLRPLNNRLNHIFPSYKATLDSHTTSYLQEFYEPYNEKLKELVGPLPTQWNYE